MKLLKYIAGDKPELKRFDGQCPHYEDSTQLWELCNDFTDILIVEHNGKKYQIVYSFKDHLITDKASLPVNRSHWYPASPFYIHHDVAFSTHCLSQFAINNDDGFRATNMLFKECINWKIKQAVKRKKISKFRAFFWHIKKRIWYRSVSSIVGQGLFVNGSPDRGYHGVYSKCEIEEVTG